MILFDSHCHLQDERFAEDRADVIARMRETGIKRCILAGSNEPSSRAIVALCKEQPDMIYGVVGYHPHDAKEWNDTSESLLTEWQKEPNIVGIGEIGLDYYYDLSPRDKQKEVLLLQLDLAYRLDVPVVFHIRDAHGDMLDVLRSVRGKLPRGVVHCYSGSVESAREYLDMGYYISFAGPLTFKNAAKLPQVAAYCPEDRILVETDSPYLAPVPMRGRRNEPSYVQYVAEKLAEIRGITADEMGRIAYRNTCRLYGLMEEL